MHCDYDPMADPKIHPKSSFFTPAGSEGSVYYQCIYSHKIHKKYSLHKPHNTNPSLVFSCEKKNESGLWCGTFL